MWKANGNPTTLQLFLDSLSPKNMRNSSSGGKLKFGDLSLEEAMDLSRDRQILELDSEVNRGRYTDTHTHTHMDSNVMS
jgi:hypothetical protein